MKEEEVIIPTWRQLVFICSWIIFTQAYVYFLGRSLPYSLYYSFDENRWDDRIKKFKEQGERTLEDIRYWQRETSEKRLLFNQGRQVCVAVISKRGSRYVKATVGSMLGRMQKSMRDAVSVTVFNVANVGAERVEPMQTADLVEEVDVAYPRWISADKYQGNAKEALDYAVVLENLYKRGCQYGVVVKEGLIAGKYWMNKILRVIDEAGRKPRWIVVRLFGNRRKEGWMHQWWYIGDWIVLIGMAAFLSLIAWLLVLGPIFLFSKEEIEAAEEMPPSWLRDISRLSAIVVILLLINFMIALLLLGRPTIMSLRGRLTPSSLMGEEVSFANLYPQEAMQTYASCLEDILMEAGRMKGTEMIKNHDLYLWNVKKRLERRGSSKMEARYKMLYMSPNVFQRIGKISITDPTGGVIVSHDFKDEDVGIGFRVKDFLENNN